MFCFAIRKTLYLNYVHITLFIDTKFTIKIIHNLLTLICQTIGYQDLT